jgi:hypothetical protein
MLPLVCKVADARQVHRQPYTTLAVLCVGWGATCSQHGSGCCKPVCSALLAAVGGIAPEHGHVQRNAVWS